MHANEIVHRDIKPDNILFSNKSEDSEVKIIDFGLASNTKDINVKNSFVGTSFYLSPEICSRK